MQPVKERSKKNLYDATYYFSLDFPISFQVDLKKSGSKEKDGKKEQRNRAAVQQENEEDGGEGDEDEAANEAEENAN